MKRYNVANFGRTSDGMEEDSYGRFVLHSEAQARIEALEVALRELTRCVFYERGITVEEYDAALAKGRAALENSNEPR